MIPVVIHASAYEKNEQGCLRHILRLIDQSSPITSCVLLDKIALEHELPISTQNFPITRINLANWLDKTNAPCKILIKHQAKQIEANQIILLDTRQHDPNDISCLLQEISQAWLHLDTWQQAFILITDDYYASRFAFELSPVFYIQPLSTSRESLQIEVNAMNSRIKLLRWLGRGRTSRLMQALFTFVQKTQRYVKKRLS